MSNVLYNTHLKLAKHSKTWLYLLPSTAINHTQPGQVNQLSYEMLDSFLGCYWEECYFTGQLWWGHVDLEWSRHVLHLSSSEMWMRGMISFGRLFTIKHWDSIWFYIWLVVKKNIWKNMKVKWDRWLFPIYGKIKNDPNHTQDMILYGFWYQ